MRYHVLACDYDGTIATHGRVDEETTASLEKLRQTGRKLILVTGRLLDELLAVFPSASLFDRIVAENGAVLFRPATHEDVALADPPPTAFVNTLRELGIQPLQKGRVIVSTWEPHETTVLEVIRRLSLELQVVFNKGAVMILPTGVNKATGLQSALVELGMSFRNTAGIGDAENDFSFLSSCECSAAVANALERIKKSADIVTGTDHGAGVREFIDRIIASDLAELDQDGRSIEIGVTRQKTPVTLPTYGQRVLIAGESGSGKSTLAATLLERLVEQQYQFCVIDPEGDYDNFQGATVVGNAKHGPAAEEVIQLLRDPAQNVIVNLLGIDVGDRPAQFRTLLVALSELRASTGRPHWLLVDESHHVLPCENDAGHAAPLEQQTFVLITVRPDKIAKSARNLITTAISVGASVRETVRAMAKALEKHVSLAGIDKLDSTQAVLMAENQGWRSIPFIPIPSRAQRQRHHRKYAEGKLGEDKSFYFRGPAKKLNLRAHNLSLFLELARGVDSETWQYHLERGEYSKWFRDAIKDEELAAETVIIEHSGLPSGQTRSLVEAAVNSRYTIPA